MKKYFIGMLALVLAVGFSAFTKPAKKVAFADTKVFEFDVTIASPTVLNDVANKANYKYIGLLADVGVCDAATDDQVCRFVVDQAQLSSTPSIGSTFASVSTGFTITPELTSPNYRVKKVEKSSYLATVSNQIP